MNISIKNFKSITSLDDFELKPFTILSGTNSSGKSSLIQFLLLLKQTVEISSANRPLYLEGSLFPVRQYLDLVNGKSISNKITCSFTFTKNELDGISSTEIDLFSSLQYQCTVRIVFDYLEGKEIVSEFAIIFHIDDIENKEQFISFQNREGVFYIESNTGVFEKDIFFEPNYEVYNIEYSAFYPSTYDIMWKIWMNDNPSNVEVKHLKKIPEISGIKSAVNKMLNNIRYIGPLREIPKEYYDSVKQISGVGSEGEFTAQLLESNADKPVNYIAVSDNDEGTEYTDVESTLINAVNYWICEQFEMCKSITSMKEEEKYKIVVESLNGIKSSIRHVGFGISQLLPVIVEGFLMPEGGTLILEQPEIHLHPRIQSKLFDFLYTLVLRDKKVILETHSDHLITRLRRRVAEDSTAETRRNVKLSFMEFIDEDFSVTTFNLDEYGTSFFPKNFIESPDQELKAIIKAQMRKRLNKHS